MGRSGLHSSARSARLGQGFAQRIVACDVERDRSQRSYLPTQQPAGVREYRERLHVKRKDRSLQESHPEVRKSPSVTTMKRVPALH